MNKEEGEGYVIRRWILEKPQQVMDKMKMVQKMSGKLQSAVDKFLQGSGGARQAPEGCRLSRVGLE